MASYNIKHIEYLRQKADLTYEQAVALLDRNDGDIGKALVELEQSGALNGKSSHKKARTEPEPQSDAKPRSFWDNIVDLFIKGLRIKLVIEREHEVIVRLPLIYLAAGVILAFRFAIISIVLMFLTGCRVHLEHYSDPDGDRRIRSYARGAERKVRDTVDGISHHVASSSLNGDKKTDGGKDDDDFDSFTVE